MTTQKEYLEAYYDDSDQARSWVEEDAREPDEQNDVLAYIASLMRKIRELSAENERLGGELGRSWAVIARMTLDVEP